MNVTPFGLSSSKPFSQVTMHFDKAFSPELRRRVSAKGGSAT